MRVVKGAEKSHVEWTGRKLVEMVEDGKVDFNIDIQRGYVWKSNEKKSAFIRSLILDRHVPPLYFNKVGDIYDGEDGKQRLLTLIKFLHDEFSLSGLEEIEIINDDDNVESFNLNGHIFSSLPECMQNAIKEFNFTICFTDNADQEEVADQFYCLNNGQGLNAATMNRVKAKSHDKLITLGKHKLFKDALSNVALEGHVNDDLVGKAHAILHAEEPEMSTSWIRSYIKTTEITDDDEKQLNEIFDRIYAVHNLIEDKKVAKRIYGRTHMVSIVPTIWKSIKDGLSEKQVMEWFVTFFNGKRFATISNAYNNAAGGSGTGKKAAVKKRLEELENNYKEFFKNDMIH